MNSSLAFRTITLTCGLIIISASDARCQFYDPLGVQNYSKPFGKYGPTFQYTSPTKAWNVLNGRNPNYQPNQQRVASRVAPTQTTRLDNLGLSVTEPAGLWEEADREPAGSTSRYMISRQDPKIVISLACEQTETRLTNSALLSESQAAIKKLGGKIEPVEQRLSAGGINGVTFSATVTDGEFSTYYAMWVATYNGRKYKLAVYGDKHDKTKIDAAMRSFVQGMRPIQKTTVAHRNNHKTTMTR